MREEAPSQKTETGLFSSLYSYIALSSEPASQRMVSQEDQEHIQQAKRCIRECHLEHLITESKFLRIDSLQEMVKVEVVDFPLFNCTQYVVIIANFKVYFSGSHSGFSWSRWSPIPWHCSKRKHCYIFLGAPNKSDNSKP